jgi:hypothetical protein
MHQTRIISTTIGYCFIQKKEIRILATQNNAITTDRLFLFKIVFFVFIPALDSSASIFRVLRSRGEADRISRRIRRSSVAAESKVFTVERPRRFAGKETGNLTGGYNSVENAINEQCRKCPN